MKDEGNEEKEKRKENRKEKEGLFSKTSTSTLHQPIVGLIKTINTISRSSDFSSAAAVMPAPTGGNLVEVTGC